MPSPPAMTDSSGSSPVSSVVAPVTVDSSLSEYTSRIRAFLLSEDDLPLWEPPTEWDGDVSWGTDQITRLKDLGIPAFITGDPAVRHRPDMLLYLLGRLHILDETFADRLQQLITANDHMYISNASGTGKTRILFEALASSWGFYFSCTANPRIDPYGSLDLSDALRAIGITQLDGAYLAEDIPVLKRLPQSWKNVVDNNRRIADRCFLQVILTRLLVLDHFLSIVSEIGMPEDAARMKWLFLQLRPRTVLTTDIFTSVDWAVSTLDDADISSRIGALYALHQSRIPIVAIDESNVAMQQHREAFMTADYRHRVPVLRQVVNCMANYLPASRLLVAGTLLEEDVVSEPIQASRSAIRSLRVFHSLGHFDSLERTSGYLRHFLADDFPMEECRRIHMWMRGRHRLLAVFVMYTLIYGATRLTRVLDTLVALATGYTRTSARLLTYVDVGLFFRDETLEHQGHSIASSLRSAVLNYALHHRPSALTTNPKRLVGLGAALYGRDVNTAQVYEPLVMLNLARWLNHSPQYGIHGIIQSRSADRMYPLGDASFPEGLASCLRDILGNHAAPSLRSFLDFEGRPPAWTDQSARIVLPRLAQRRSPFAEYTSGTEACVELASSSDGVFHWLEDASRPFLIPDPEFGAALLFVVELADSQRLLMCLDQQSLRKRNDGRVLRDHPVVPLKAGDFYKRNEPARERLRVALAKFSSDGSQRCRRTSPMAQASISKHNIINLFCFSRLSRAGTTYNPPAAVIKLSYLLQQQRPVEFEMAHVLDSINGT